MRAQRNQRLVNDLCVEFGEDAKIGIGNINDRTTGSASQGVGITLGADGQRTAAPRTLEGPGLNAGVGIPTHRHDFAQPAQVEIVEARLLTDKHQRRVFAVVKRGEHPAARLQIHHRRLVARADPDRQFTLASDAAGVLDIGDLKSAPLER